MNRTSFSVLRLEKYYENLIAFLPKIRFQICFILSPSTSEGLEILTNVYPYQLISWSIKIYVDFTDIDVDIFIRKLSGISNFQLISVVIKCDTLQAQYVYRGRDLDADSDEHPVIKLHNIVAVSTNIFKNQFQKVNTIDKDCTTN